MANFTPFANSAGSGLAVDGNGKSPANRRRQFNQRKNAAPPARQTCPEPGSMVIVTCEPLAGVDHFGGGPLRRSCSRLLRHRLHIASMKVCWPSAPG